MEFLLGWLFLFLTCGQEGWAAYLRKAVLWMLVFVLFLGYGMVSGLVSTDVLEKLFYEPEQMEGLGLCNTLLFEKLDKLSWTKHSFPYTYPATQCVSNRKTFC